MPALTTSERLLAIGAVVSRGPTLSLVARKFARQSHAAIHFNRKEIARLIRNKMELLAKSRRPAGGRAYGYMPASQNGTGKIEIDEQQAGTVRPIFEWPRHVAMLR